MPSQLTKPAGRLPSKSGRSALYEDRDGKIFFVPTIGMWQYRKAASPVQILSRIGEAQSLWYYWQKRFADTPVLIPWLRHFEPLPRELKPVYPSTVQNLARGPRDDEIFVTSAMVKFREASNVNALAKPLRSEGVINPAYWLKVYRHLPWFAKWLHGDPPPENVVVATGAEIAKCLNAWNYGAHAKAATNRSGRSHAYSLYAHWLMNCFPLDQLEEWVEWLYGGSDPAGWYIVPERLVRLSSRLGVSRICDAAGLNKEQVFSWRRHPKIGTALQEAIQSARGPGGVRTPSTEAWRWLAEQSTSHHTPRVRLQYESLMADVLRYAKAASVGSACTAIGMARSTWNADQIECEKLAGADAQKQLVELVEGGRQPGQEPCGAIGRLFIPPPTMRQFRKLARSAASGQQIPAIRRRCSDDCFRQWFLDWTVPATLRKRINKANNTALASPPASEATTNDRHNGGNAPVQTIDDLNPLHAKWIVLHDKGCHSYFDIARREPKSAAGKTVPRTTVSTAIHRMRDKLAALGVSVDDLASHFNIAISG